MKKLITESDFNRLADLLEKCKYEIQNLSDQVYQTKHEEISGMVSLIEFNEWCKTARKRQTDLQHSILKFIGDMNHFQSNEHPDLVLNTTPAEINMYKSWGGCEQLYYQTFGEKRQINTIAEFEAALQLISKENNKPVEQQ